MRNILFTVILVSACGTPITQENSLKVAGNVAGATATQVPQDDPATVAAMQVDPSVIATQHNASPEELKNLNCSGSAVVTDMGMDRNMNGKLEVEEIQNTSANCTTTVGSSTPAPPQDDPKVIATQHNASHEELRKLSCRGTAVITSMGMDRNMNGKLESEEIQSTSANCTSNSRRRR